MIKVGRWCLTFRRYTRGRYAVTRPFYRRGGQCTPGPWWELGVPPIGELTLSRDRTLFGWDDPANHG